jgi:hypothetical protein
MTMNLDYPVPGYFVWGAQVSGSPIDSSRPPQTYRA